MSNKIKCAYELRRGTFEETISFLQKIRNFTLDSFFSVFNKFQISYEIRPIEKSLDKAIFEEYHFFDLMIIDREILLKKIYDSLKKILLERIAPAEITCSADLKVKLNAFYIKEEKDIIYFNIYRYRRNNFLATNADKTFIIKINFDFLFTEVLFYKTFFVERQKDLYITNVIPAKNIAGLFGKSYPLENTEIFLEKLKENRLIEQSEDNIVKLKEAQKFFEGEEIKVMFYDRQKLERKTKFSIGFLLQKLKDVDFPFIFQIRLSYEPIK